MATDGNVVKCRDTRYVHRLLSKEYRTHSIGSICPACSVSIYLYTEPQLRNIQDDAILRTEGEKE